MSPAYLLVWLAQQEPRAALAPEAVRGELERVLARAEFHSEPSLLDRALDWLSSHLGIGEIEALGEIVRVALFIAALVAVVLLARRIARAFGARGPTPAGVVETGPSLGARIAALADAARAARAGGDLRLALRLLFQALLLSLGGRGDLEFRPAWTNRELLRRGRLKLHSRALLEGLVRELEPKEFGRASISPVDLERLEGLLAEHGPTGRSRS